jgi:DNA-binding transcriptional LysR family regulator
MFPDFVAPAISVNIGWLGLQHVVANGGSGFFPYRLVDRYIDSGRLTIPAGSPEFALPAYVVYPEDANPEILALMLDSMRRVVVDLK